MSSRTMMIATDPSTATGKVLREIVRHVSSAGAQHSVREITEAVSKKIEANAPTITRCTYFLLQARNGPIKRVTNGNGKEAIKTVGVMPNFLQIVREKRPKPAMNIRQISTSAKTKFGRITQTIHHVVNTEPNIPEGGYTSSTLFPFVQEQHEKMHGEKIDSNEFSKSLSAMVRAKNATIFGERNSAWGPFYGIKPKSSKLDDFLSTPRSTKAATVPPPPAPKPVPVPVPPATPTRTPPPYAAPTAATSDIADAMKGGSAPYGGSREDWVRWRDDRKFSHVLAIRSVLNDEIPTGPAHDIWKAWRDNLRFGDYLIAKSVFNEEWIEL
jgi:hypothetical protein